MDRSKSSGRRYPKVDLPVGMCNLCGLVKELTYEHVPPQAAFNSYRFIMLTADEYWNGVHKGQKITRKPIQGGHGIYSLCKDCNSWTGGAYGRAFAEWSRKGHENYSLLKRGESDVYFLDIRPLRILKQLATMFIAMYMHDVNFRNRNMSLVRFALDQFTQWLNPRYRFWVYYVAPGPLRMTTFSSVMKTDGNASPVTGVEISYPPFGYMLTFGSVPQDSRLVEITGFKRWQYRDRDMIKLHLSVLPTHGPMMGDYRYFDNLPERKLDDIRYIITLY